LPEAVEVGVVYMNIVFGIDIVDSPGVGEIFVLHAGGLIVMKSLISGDNIVEQIRIAVSGSDIVAAIGGGVIVLVAVAFAVNTAASGIDAPGDDVVDDGVVEDSRIKSVIKGQGAATGMVFAGIIGDVAFDEVVEDIDMGGEVADIFE